MIPLLCPVRRCGLALERGGRSLSCAHGHSFDRARSGYVNLLQPQDRRSKHPGDTRAAAEARRRMAEKGLEDWLLAEVLAAVDRVSRNRGHAVETVLDVGCGEGFLLGSLEKERAIDAHGLDLSAAAVDLAARKYPRPAWVVANADRALPWPDRSFDLVTSFTSRRRGAEIARVTARDGRFLAALPADDDLCELRAALFGRATRRDRAARAIEELLPRLELVSRRSIRRRSRLDRDSLRDVLTATYRGARRREAERARELGGMEVTFSRELLVFRRRP